MDDRFGFFELSGQESPLVAIQLLRSNRGQPVAPHFTVFAGTDLATQAVDQGGMQVQPGFDPVLATASLETSQDFAFGDINSAF
jgi:hypothetical protein